MRMAGLVMGKPYKTKEFERLCGFGIQFWFFRLRRACLPPDC
jgi:hypothetical protein